MISNGRYYQKNTTLPVAHLDIKIREYLTSAVFNESISELIGLTQRDSDFLHTSIDPNYFHYIDDAFH